jgi:hypothetical protein
MYKQNVQYLWDTIKSTNWITGKEEKEVQSKSTENIIHKTIVENFPNLQKEVMIQVVGATGTPSKQD